MGFVAQHGRDALKSSLQLFSSGPGIRLKVVASLDPSVAKPEGFRVKASEGDVVVFYFELSATQDLKFSGFPAGQTTWQNRRHPSCPGVARRAKTEEFIWGNIQKMVLSQ